MTVAVVIALRFICHQDVIYLWGRAAALFLHHFHLIPLIMTYIPLLLEQHLHIRMNHILRRNHLLRFHLLTELVLLLVVVVSHQIRQTVLLRNLLSRTWYVLAWIEMDVVIWLLLSWLAHRIQATMQSLYLRPTLLCLWEFGVIIRWIGGWLIEHQLLWPIRLLAMMVEFIRLNIIGMILDGWWWEVVMLMFGLFMIGILEGIWFLAISAHLTLQLIMTAWRMLFFGLDVTIHHVIFSRLLHEVVRVLKSTTAGLLMVTILVALEVWLHGKRGLSGVNGLLEVCLFTVFTIKMALVQVHGFLYRRSQAILVH